MLKIERDLKELKNNPNLSMIANHLIEQSKLDPLIAKSLDKESKSLKGLDEFIIQEAKKEIKKQAGYIHHETIYGWAQHYYDEDSIIMPHDEKVKSQKKLEPVELPEENEDAWNF